MRLGNATVAFVCWWGKKIHISKAHIWGLKEREVESARRWPECLVSSSCVAFNGEGQTAEQTLREETWDQGRGGESVLHVRAFSELYRKWEVKQRATLYSVIQTPFNSWSPVIKKKLYYALKPATDMRQKQLATLAFSHCCRSSVLNVERKHVEVMYIVKKKPSRQRKTFRGYRNRKSKSSDTTK